MPETLTVPVSVVENAADSALATHEVLDEAAHQQIASTEDEDYAWLTERLDATNREVATLREQLTNQFETRVQAMLSAFNESTQQSRTLIEAQTQMIATLTESLTALNQSVLSKLTPNDSESSSTNESEQQPTETVTEAVAVESQEATPERRAASAKKRLRI
jgi:hypothetical protein